MKITNRTLTQIRNLVQMQKGPDSAEEQDIIDLTIVSGNNTVRTANMTLEDGDEVTQTQAQTKSLLRLYQNYLL